MSKNVVYSPYKLETIGAGGPDAAHIRLPEALSTSVPNTSPRPPVFFVKTGQTQLLNYSFRTGEEFALEFMQDRANTRKPLVSIISDDRTTNSSFTHWEQEANISGDKPSKKLLTFPPFSETSSQGSNKRNPQDTYNHGATRMKFICNFGGRFLPRPIDGKLRYVGGEKHLIQISQGMSWQGLFTDEDDEHHVHFVVGSASDEDKEGPKKLHHALGASVHKVLLQFHRRHPGSPYIRFLPLSWNK